MARITKLLPIAKCAVDNPKASARAEERCSTATEGGGGAAHVLL